MKKIIPYLLLLCCIGLILALSLQINNLNSRLNQIESLKNDTQKTVETVDYKVDSSISQVYNKVSGSVVTVISDSGSGSGVIYKVNGREKYIVTNHHVVEGSQGFNIILATGETIEAQLVGSDPYFDLAVLKMESDQELKPIALGDSSLVQVGETVMAIGSPNGQNFAGSLTVGVISGKDRVIEVDVDNDRRPDWDMVLLQTDAAINPGNSGGALVNLAGELIGINNMKIVRNTIEGIAFSIPVNEVINVVKQLETSGKVIRPEFGIAGRNMEELHQLNAYSRQFSLPQIEKGVFISNVMQQSVALEMGIQVGDVITEINDKKVDNFKELRQALYGLVVGEELKVKVFRNGNIETLIGTVR